MKYANVILTVIAILLLSIALKLTNISALLTVSNRNSLASRNLNQEILNSNYRLEKSFLDFVNGAEKPDSILLKTEKGGK